MSFSREVILGTAGGVAGIAALGLALRRRKKSAAELERARRLAVNTIGRITDGVLVEATRSPDEAAGLLYYRYSAAGVEYSAAQDGSSLRHLVPLETCWPGVQATVKYDPHNPSNSIIACEQWNGLSTAQPRRTRGKTVGPS